MQSAQPPGASGPNPYLDVAGTMTEQHLQPAGPQAGPDHLQWYGPPPYPYRQAPAWAVPQPRRRAPRPAPFRVVVLDAVFPTHLVSARVNVARIEGGEHPPMLHMFRQSTQPESAAELVPLLHHHDLRVRQGVAALLEQERKSLTQGVAQQRSWRERDVASWRTLARLDAAAPEIDAVLGTVDRSAARQVLLEISRVANEGRSLEELLAVPDAEAWSREGGTRTRGDVY